MAETPTETRSKTLGDGSSNDETLDLDPQVHHDGGDVRVNAG